MVPTDDHLFRVNEGDQAAVVGHIHDAAEVRALGRVVSVKSSDPFPELVDKGLRRILVDQDIIRGHTGLARIEELPVGNAPHRRIQVGVVVDDAGAFAAQFQGHGRQVPGRGLKDNSPHPGGARKKDMVEFLGQEHLGFRHLTGHIGHMLGPEAVADEILDHPAHVGGKFRRLDHGGVAGGNGCDERGKGALHRIVERRDDQVYAQGGVAYLADPGQKVKGGHLPFDAHPFLQGLHGPGQVMADDSGFRDKGLIDRFAQIGLEGIMKALLMAANAILKGFQGVEPELMAQGGMGVEKSALVLDDVVDLALGDHDASSSPS